MTTISTMPANRVPHQVNAFRAVLGFYVVCERQEKHRLAERE